MTKTESQELVSSQKIEVLNNVPIMSSEDVAKLQAELAAIRAEKAALESDLENSRAIPRGQAMPESADPFVPAESDHVELETFNDPQVTQEALRSGKTNYAHSRITHKNYAPGMGSHYEAMPGEAHATVPAGTYWMYDEGGWARRVQRQSISSAFQSGLTPTCPLCHGRHKESETNPNACPKRRKVKYTICQICQATGSMRYIWDVQDRLQVGPDGRPLGGDANVEPELMVEMDLPSTPEARLKIRLEDHIRKYHPATAAAMRLGDVI